MSGPVTERQTEWVMRHHMQLYWNPTLSPSAPAVVYLYFCKSWCLSLSITNDLVCPALFQVSRVDRRLCGLGTAWWCLILRSRLLDPHTLHVICIRLSVNVTCKMWFVALFCTCDSYFMSVCPERRIPPLWLFLRFLPLFFYPVKRIFFSINMASFSSLKLRV